MGVSPPYLYDPVKTDGFRSSYKEFDPRAASRASFEPRNPRPKSTGPLVSFNQHPDSYLILPYGKTDAKHMNPSVKKWIKWLRVSQLVLRCFEFLAGCGVLGMMILISGVDNTIAWIMRIVSGVALLHTAYAAYHHTRKASGRTPASSGSYQLFASFFDVSVVPFYAYGALVAMTREGEWTTILTNKALVTIFIKVFFYCTTIGGGLHLISLAISIYLAVTFRRITQLPPDMNPLEDNLTSRHKRNKSSISVATTMSEKRLSTPLEAKRSSGAAYEDLSRPPTIPFFHTRNQSTDSFSTYKSTPPPSRDSRLDLPSRQYQAISNSPRSSVADLKRSSGVNTPSKRASYYDITTSDTASQNSHSGRTLTNGRMAEGWYTTDSLNSPKIRNSPSPRKTQYKPLHQRNDFTEDVYDHPNPLEAHPPTPRHSQHGGSALSEISNNRRVSGDIADMAPQMREMSPNREFRAKLYGELKPGTPPVMIGKGRQVSSGNDLGDNSGFRVMDRRDVSGKIAEEGRGGDGNGKWGTRFRKISGL